MLDKFNDILKALFVENADLVGEFIATHKRGPLRVELPVLFNELCLNCLNVGGSSLAKCQAAGDQQNRSEKAFHTRILWKRLANIVPAAAGNGKARAQRQVNIIQA